MTTLGAPGIGPRVPDASPRLVENLPYAVLTPREIVTWTRRMRRIDSDMLDGDDLLEPTRRQLRGAVFFQIGGNAGEGFVFLLDTVDAAGEMRVGDYAHDYLGEVDWTVEPGGGGVFASLAASTAWVAGRIEEHLDWGSDARARDSRSSTRDGGPRRAPASCAAPAPPRRRLRRNLTQASRARDPAGARPGAWSWPVRVRARSSRSDPRCRRATRCAGSRTPRPSSG